jgi:hypothetical protein
LRLHQLICPPSLQAALAPARKCLRLRVSSQGGVQFPTGGNGLMAEPASALRFLVKRLGQQTPV